jgi:hypothetical protein
LHQHGLAGLAVLADFGFDEPAALPDDTEVEAVRLQHEAVGVPTRLQRVLGVVEQVDVHRHPGRGEQFVQGRGTRDVAFTGGDPVIG